MTLSQFIRDNMEAILNEWQEFAASIPSAAGMDVRGLRDDAENILLAIALDMESAQSIEEQSAKSRGSDRRRGGKTDTAAEMHGGTRFVEGFNLKEMVSEYRALRASVIRQWLVTPAAGQQDRLYELIRFNEGIDQALTESIARFSDRLDRSRELFMGVLSHDLRTPVHVIRQSVPLLLRSSGNTQQQREAASYIDRSSVAIL